MDSCTYIILFYSVLVWLRIGFLLLKGQARIQDSRRILWVKKWQIWYDLITSEMHTNAGCRTAKYAETLLQLTFNAHAEVVPHQCALIRHALKGVSGSCRLSYTHLIVLYKILVCHAPQSWLLFHFVPANWLQSCTATADHLWSLAPLLLTGSNAHGQLFQTGNEAVKRCWVRRNNSTSGSGEGVVFRF